MSNFQLEEQTLIDLENQRAELVEQMEAAQVQAQRDAATHRAAVGAAVLDGTTRSRAVVADPTEAQTKAAELAAAVEVLESRIAGQAERAAVAQYSGWMSRRNELATASHDLARRQVEAMKTFLELSHERAQHMREFSDLTRRLDTFEYTDDLELPETERVSPVLWGNVPRFNTTWLEHPASMARGAQSLGVWLDDNE